MLIEQEVSELVIGSYIVAVTKPSDKYQINGLGWIKSESTLEILREKGVQRVMIDISKQRGQAFLSLGTEQVKTDLFIDIAKAQELFMQSKEVQRKLLQEVSLGHDIDLQSVAAVTSGTVEAIFDNPDALACVINARIKDEYLLEHSICVSVLMAIFSRYMGFDKELVKSLCIGAFLHDIGKVKIPGHILHKPARLTEAEFEVMKTHVDHTLEAMAGMQGISEFSVEVAAQHHEKLDASGYPLALNGEQISLYGRMISVCDIYDALTASRCYKEGLPKVKAFAILRNMAAQGQLDKQLVDAFIKCLGVYPIGALVRLNSNQLAMVEARNESDAVRPRVTSFYDLSANCFKTPVSVDLGKSRDQQILECINADQFGLDMQQVLGFLASGG